jgi:probable rRNA maturation factor
MRTAIAHAAPPAESAISLVFVDDARMRQLNERYRGVARTTDVLSFGHPLPGHARAASAVAAMPRDPDGGLDLGDILISTEVARRQARRTRRSLGEEVAFLAAHGALHLLGYEDETPSGYREMRRLGREALAEGRRVVSARRKG